MQTGICTSPDNALMLEKGLADYVELNLTSLAQMSEKEFEETKNKLSSFGIKTLAANCFFPGDIRLCGKELNLTYVLEYSEKALKRASMLGIGICVLGSGRARSVGDGEDADECMNDIETVCLKIGDIAKKYGIIIVIEPLNKNETNIFNLVSDAAEFVRKLNHSNIKLLADVYHMALENEPLDAIYDNADIIRHIHVANPEGRVFPDESDSYDYGAVYKILKKSGYDACISIEAGSKSDFKTSAAKSLVFLKSIFK